MKKITKKAIKRMRKGKHVVCSFDCQAKNYYGEVWSGEIWKYNSVTGLYECRYLESNFEKTFFTEHITSEVIEIFDHYETLIDVHITV